MLSWVVLYAAVVGGVYGLWCVGGRMGWWLCSPLVDVGLFEARIDGKGGGREIVEFGLCG